MRENIRLVSSAGTGTTYVTTKDKRAKPEKLTLKKFDPKLNAHVAFVEQRMPSSKK